VEEAEVPRDYLHPAIAPLVEARLEPEEFERRVSAPLSAEEIAETAELVRWFTHRYPTVKSRLDYARRKYAEWTRPVEIMPIEGAD
jgi:hypothetical protein